MKNLVIIICLVGIVGLWGYYFYRDIKTLSSSKTTITVISPTPTLEILPTPTISDIDLIKTAFAKKHQKPVSDIILKISENDSNYSRGSISFSGENGGGWWLAAKVNGIWIAVQDGNGYVSCDAILPYKFPKAMIPECVNSKGKLVIL